MSETGSNEWRGRVAVLVAFAVVYGVLTRLSHVMVAELDGPAGIWPQGGLALGALMLVSRRRWPGFLVPIVLINLAFNATTGYPWTLNLGFTLANTIEPALGAALVQHAHRGPVRLDTLPSLRSFLVWGVVASPALAAVLGAATLHWGASAPLLSTWFLWWVADALGVLVVAPLLVTWRHFGYRLWDASRRTKLEALATISGLLILTCVVFEHPMEMPGMLPLYILFPLLVWTALRFGLTGATTASAGIGAIATVETILGSGPFVTDSIHQSVTYVQSFLGVFAVSGLAPAVLLAEREHAMERVRSSENLFRSFAGTVDDIFWIFDRDAGTHLYVSPAFDVISGHAADDLYADPELWLRLIHPDDRPRVEDAMRAYRGGVFEMQYRIVRPDGGVRWIRDRGIPSEQPDAKRRMMVGIAEDVTIRRRLEDRLVQTQRMESLGQLAGGVAHDFNNLLTAITGSTRVVRRWASENADLEMAVEQIDDAAERARQLTKQLLVFAQQEPGEPRTIDVCEIVTGLEQLLRNMLRPAITLDIEVAEEGLRVNLDPAQLEQVVINLVVNAQDAIEDYGHIKVGCQLQEIRADETAQARLVPGSYVCVWVEDDGVGISSEVMERIFEPFYTTKEAGKGTGLGLATCFGIAIRNGGDLRVRSSVGHGSRFELLLPPASGCSDEPHPGADDTLAA